MKVKWTNVPQETVKTVGRIFPAWTFHGLRSVGLLEEPTKEIQKYLKKMRHFGCYFRFEDKTGGIVILNKELKAFLKRTRQSTAEEYSFWLLAAISHQFFHHIQTLLKQIHPGLYAGNIYYRAQKERDVWEATRFLLKAKGFFTIKLSIWKQYTDG